MSKVDYAKKYLTRSKGGYSPYPNFGVKFSNSFFPYMTKLWNNLKVSTKVMMLSDFKEQLKNDRNGGIWQSGISKSLYT